MRFLSLCYEQKKKWSKTKLLYQYNCFHLQLASELYMKHLNLKMSLLITAVYTVYIYKVICANAFKLVQWSLLFHFSTSGVLSFLLYWLSFRKLLHSFLRENCFKRGRWEHLQSEIWKLSLRGRSVSLGTGGCYTF